MTERGFVERQQAIRRDLLAALYGLRRQGKGGFVRQLTRSLGYDPDECRFALDYLMDAGLICRESVHCRLTAQGIERFEREYQ